MTDILSNYIPNQCPECNIDLICQKHLHVELDHCNNCNGIFVGLGIERHIIGEFGCQDIWIESQLCTNLGKTQSKSPKKDVCLEHLKVS